MINALQHAKLLPKGFTYIRLKAGGLPLPFLQSCAAATAPLHLGPILN